MSARVRKERDWRTSAHPHVLGWRFQKGQRTRRQWVSGRKRAGRLRFRRGLGGWLVFAVCTAVLSYATCHLRAHGDQPATARLPGNSCHRSELRHLPAGRRARVETGRGEAALLPAEPVPSPPGFPEEPGPTLPPRALSARADPAHPGV